MTNFLGELKSGQQLPTDFYWPAHIDDYIPFSEQFLLSQKEFIPELDWLIACRNRETSTVHPLIWHDRDGQMVLGFDYAAWLTWVKHEQYRPEHKASLLNKLPFHYHFIPGNIRNALLKVLLLTGNATKRREKTFPPSESNAGVDILSRLSEQNVLPAQATLVLTHDIDTIEGFHYVDMIARLEEKYGFRSSWNIVPKHYTIDYAILDDLKSRGHEIGLHGIWHNNQEAFLKEADFRRELKSVQPFLTKYDVKGYRSPSWYRTKKMFDVLAEFFSYDLSTLDNDTICPAGNGGVGMMRPFFMTEKLVELPCTLPFEVPLFQSVAPRELISFWKNKIDYIYHAKAMLLVNTHPDPNYLGNKVLLHEYENLLKLFHQAQWDHALPHMVAKRHCGN